MLAYIAVVGNPLSKMGWRTGWTSGAITRTCFNVVPAYSPNLSPPVQLLCQYEASAYGNGGDSGAPVFRRLGTYDTNGREKVGWAGVICCNNAANGQNQPAPFIFADYASVVDRVKTDVYWTP